MILKYFGGFLFLQKTHKKIVRADSLEDYLSICHRIKAIGSRSKETMIEPTHWKLVSNLRLTAGGQAFFFTPRKNIKNVSPLAAGYLGDVAVSNRALKSLPLFLTTYFSRVSKKFSICNERRLGTLGTLDILGTLGRLGHPGHRGHQGTP